jgi:hypothetical protein
VIDVIAIWYADIHSQLVARVVDHVGRNGTACVAASTCAIRHTVLNRERLGGREMTRLVPPVVCV